MKTSASLLACVVALLAGCGKSTPPAPTPAPKSAAAATPSVPAAEKPQLQGVIQDILPDRSSLVIKHEAIPGVMRGMTMAFRVDATTLQAARKGQSITGDFESSGGMNFALSNVKLGAAPVSAPAAAPEPAMPMMPGMKMDMPTAAPPAQPGGRN
jgi:Cu/Ag efflux protein CusF